MLYACTRGVNFPCARVLLFDNISTPSQYYSQAEGYDSTVMIYLF